MSRGWDGVDDFVGAGVLVTGASFVFDGARIRFEAVDVLGEAGIFFGELVNLAGEGFVVGALLLPAGEAIAAVDHVPREEECEDNGSDGADASAIDGVVGRPAL